MGSTEQELRFPSWLFECIDAPGSQLPCCFSGSALPCSLQHERGHREHQALPALSGLFWGLMHQMTEFSWPRYQEATDDRHLQCGCICSIYFWLLWCFQTLHHGLNIWFIPEPPPLHGSKVMITFLGFIQASILTFHWRFVGRKGFCRHIHHKLALLCWCTGVCLHMFRDVTPG